MSGSGFLELLIELFMSDEQKPDPDARWQRLFNRPSADPLKVNDAVQMGLSFLREFGYQAFLDHIFDDRNLLSTPPEREAISQLRIAESYRMGERIGLADSTQPPPEIIDSQLRAILETMASTPERGSQDWKTRVTATANRVVRGGI